MICSLWIWTSRGQCQSDSKICQFPIIDCQLCGMRAPNWQSESAIGNWKSAELNQNAHPFHDWVCAGERTGYRRTRLLAVTEVGESPVPGSAFPHAFRQ